MTATSDTKAKRVRTAPTAQSRTATHAIQGFLYQFNKTILEILAGPDDAEIVVEGIIEDIDIHQPTQTTAIQCKYHEAQAKFTLSLVYRPILQMMEYFHRNPNSNVHYCLFAHFPDQVGTSALKLSSEQVTEILASENEDLIRLIAKLKGKSHENFLSRFELQFGPSYDALVQEITEHLENLGFLKGDIPTVVYPNAFHIVANRSKQRDVSNRKISRKELISDLRYIKSTTISRWTLALKTAKQILMARRNQLRQNLKVNTRRRAFIVAETPAGDFSDEIVKFISEYVEKYHIKPTHTETPLFCLVCSEDSFEDILQRLHKKGVKANTGYVGQAFDRGHFTRPPVVGPPRTQPTREFSVRLIRSETDYVVLNQPKYDDFFLIDSKLHPEIDLKDVNEERLAVENFRQARYLLGLSDAHD